MMMEGEYNNNLENILEGKDNIWQKKKKKKI